MYGPPAQIWWLHYVGSCFSPFGFCAVGVFLVKLLHHVRHKSGPYIMSCLFFAPCNCVRLGFSRESVYIMYGGPAQIWSLHYVGSCFGPFELCAFGVFLVKCLHNAWNRFWSG
jgi:hypothetical protein